MLLTNFFLLAFTTAISTTFGIWGGNALIKIFPQKELAIAQLCLSIALTLTLSALLFVFTTSSGIISNLTMNDVVKPILVLFVTFTANTIAFIVGAYLSAVNEHNKNKEKVPAKPILTGH